MESIWIVLCAVILLLLAYMRYEASHVEVVHKDLSEGGQSLRAVLLSDIHIGRMKVPVRRVAEAVKKYEPDLLLLAGDYVEHAGEVPRFLRFLGEVERKVPVFLCLGNHDVLVFKGIRGGLRKFMSRLTAAGAEVLDNRTVRFEKNGMLCDITGISELRNGRPDIKKAFSSRQAGAGLRLVLTHNPEMALSLSGRDADFVFCGHFHGGQIWMPFNIEFRTMRRESISKMGVKRGLHRVNGVQVYVSRGLGNVVMPLRFLSRPEITVLDLPVREAGRP